VIPANFPESNAVLGHPTDMTADQCDPLCIQRGFMVLNNGPVVVAVQSCWKLTPDELETVKRTGRIWLTVLGMSMPPVILSGSRIELDPIEV